MNTTIFFPLLLNTIQKEIRSKTLIVTLIFTVCILLLVNSGIDFVISMIPQNLPMDMSEQKISFFLFFVSAWSTILCVLFGTDTIASDLDSGVASVLFPLPMKRFEYLMARILGTSVIVITYFVGSLILAYIILSFSDTGAKLHGGIFKAWVSTTVSVVSMVTLSLLLSFYLNRVLSFIGTFIFTAVLSAAHYNFGAEPFGEMLTDMSFLKGLGLVLYWIFPHFGAWSNMTQAFLLEKSIDEGLAFEIGHFLVTYTVFLFLINWILKRREV